MRASTNVEVKEMHRVRNTGSTSAKVAPAVPQPSRAKTKGNEEVASLFGVLGEGVEDGAASLERLSLNGATHLPAEEVHAPGTPHSSGTPAGLLVGGTAGASGTTPPASVVSRCWGEEMEGAAEGGSSHTEGTVSIWQALEATGDAGSDLSSVSTAERREVEIPQSLEVMQDLHDEFWGRIKPAMDLNHWGMAEALLRDLGRTTVGFLDRRGAGLSRDQERMMKGRVTETVLQILNTYRKRGMQEPSVVGRELAKLARDPDLSREHKVKIGVMKGMNCREIV